MNSLIHADIFFFVTTVCVVLVTILFVILFIYTVKILSDIRKLSEKARTEGSFLLNEVHDMAERMQARTFNFKVIYRFVRSLLRRYYKYY